MVSELNINLEVYIMRKTIVTFITAFFTIYLVSGAALWADGKKEMTIDKLPSTTEEFVEMRNKIAKTPEGGAYMMMVTLLTMSKDEALGTQFLTITLNKRNITNGNVYKGYKPGSSIQYHLDRVKRGGKNFWEYTPYGYVKGATPDNKYQVEMPYTIVLSRNRYSGDESKGKVKVFIDCYGVMPRPVTLKRNSRGYWKVYEMSSFFLPVQAPAIEDDGDDL